MSQKYPGGFITKTPTAPTSSAAPGIWTLDQAMQNQKAGNWPSPPSPYIEDYFSTWLYTGNGSTQTITNGIDLAGEGGLVWLKSRTNAASHELVDTVRGANKRLQSDTTGAESAASDLAAFNSNGFDLQYLTAQGNASGQNYVSWTFRKQPKFFTQGTYSGNGSTQAITHDLGSAPGCVIVKNITTSGSWIVWHRGLSSGYYIQLNGTGAQDNLNATRRFGNNSATVDPTSTTITVGDLINTSGDTWVYYAFAHDAGGFGLTGSDNVISCGSASATGVTAVSLGYEPQFCMLKKSSGIGGWFMTDTMRGWNMQGDVDVRANVADAETDRTGSGWFPSATGFTFDSAQLNGSGDYIYIAIRRGPMKVPTDGTSVFGPVTFSGTGSAQTINSTFNAPSAAWSQVRNTGGWSSPVFYDRLRGPRGLFTDQTAAEIASADYGVAVIGNTQTAMPVGMFSSSSGKTYVAWAFGRAPGYFDVVCYSGTGSATTFSHNLGVVPELMIFKVRGSTGSWQVYAAPLGATNALILESTNASAATSNFNNTAPTSSVFSVGSFSGTNGSGLTYVNYLFASCPGVSKVGSYTGTGATQTINCGFTGGARFVLIKATSTTGDWYVWDSARGIVAGNDPYLEINTTDAEVTTTDWVDTAATGFELSNSGGNLANTNGVSYIFLAIA